MPRKSLGVLANNFGVSQMSFNFIRKANELVKSRADLDIFGFYGNLSPQCLKPCFSMMQLVEAYSFGGITVATDLDSLAKLIRMPGPSKKFFYSWDLFWMRMNPRPQYESIVSLYRHPSIEVVARSESHKAVLENNFNLTGVKISEDFDLGVFLN